MDYVVDGLSNMDLEAYSILYNWFTADKSKSEVSDQEYIDSMYYEVLNRVERDEEREYWIAQLQNEMTRQEVLYSFL